MTRQTYNREEIIETIGLDLKNGITKDVIMANLMRKYKMPAGTAYGFVREAMVRKKVGRA